MSRAGRATPPALADFNVSDGDGSMKLLDQWVTVKLVSNLGIWSVWNIGENGTDRNHLAALLCGNCSCICQSLGKTCRYCLAIKMAVIIIRIHIHQKSKLACYRIGVSLLKQSVKSQINTQVETILVSNSRPMADRITKKATHCGKRDGRDDDDDVLFHGVLVGLTVRAEPPRAGDAARNRHSRLTKSGNRGRLQSIVRPCHIAHLLTITLRLPSTLVSKSMVRKWEPEEVATTAAGGFVDAVAPS